MNEERVVKNMIISLIHLFINSITMTKTIDTSNVHTKTIEQIIKDLKNNYLKSMCALLYTNIPKTFEELYFRINR